MTAGISLSPGKTGAHLLRLRAIALALRGAPLQFAIIIFHMITASGASPLISLANIGRLDLQKTIGESV